MKSKGYYVIKRSLLDLGTSIDYTPYVVASRRVASNAWSATGHAMGRAMVTIGRQIEAPATQGRSKTAQGARRG